MDFQQMLAEITPDIHRNLLRAIETGRWADGRFLAPEQRELCLQAIIAYEARHLPEPDRVGFIDRAGKAPGERCGEPPGDAQPEPVRWG